MHPMNDHAGSGAPVPTLFLLCQNMRAADQSWLGHILSQYGFLDDGDDGIAHIFPINAQHWGTSIGVTGGPVAAQMLREQAQLGAASLAGLDIVPDMQRCDVVALSLQRLPATARAQAVQRLAFMAATLCEVVQASAMFWPPAQLWSNPNDLAAAVIAMEEQGLPPLLHFVAFAYLLADKTDVAGEHGISTHGLAWMVGQEIEVMAPLTLANPEILRRCARLAVDVMVKGAYAGPMEVAGLSRGEVLSIAAVDQSGPVGIVRAKIVI